MKRAVITKLPSALVTLVQAHVLMKFPLSFPVSVVNCQFSPLYWNFLRTGVGYGELRILGEKKKSSCLTTTTLNHIQYLSHCTDLTSAKLCNCLYFPRFIHCLYHQIPLKKIFSSQKDSEKHAMIQIPTNYVHLRFLFLRQYGFSYRVTCVS